MLRALIISSLLVSLTACGGGGGSGQSTPPAPVTVTPGSLTGVLQKTELPPPSILTATPAGLPEFIAFESGQVRPLAISPDGQQLFAVNTPDNRLEVFTISGQELLHTDSIPVGMEPVAVAVHGSTVWVVNHLSDSVSIVSFAESPARVVRTLLVGDEPRDIVFAGANFNRAFVTTAHRGQNHVNDPQLTTPGIGRADVWVFEVDNPGDQLGGSPLTVLSLFGDTPRALATSPDGAKVYAAVFNSGNQTTVIRSIPTTSKAPPFANVEGVMAPKSALILKFNGVSWVDEAGVDFSVRAGLNLPDVDVFEIDAMATVPEESNRWAGVGTTLFNLAVSPVDGRVYVSNTDARNHVRFEGPGNTATTVRAHFTESRISVLAADGSVQHTHLNSHINRDSEFGTDAERQAALALPLDLSVSNNGEKLYVAAMGSNKIGVLDTAAMDNQSFDPAAQVHVSLSGGGPTGFVKDNLESLAYVLTRYDNGISIIDLITNTEIGHITMDNPEPDSITVGRPLLYDASRTSSKGDSSCALCHVFGDTDHLSWDLGNPDEVEVGNPLVEVPFTTPPFGEFRLKQQAFHPMKGPKGTQSLRGMANHGPLHWRGDRTGANPSGGESREEAAFKEFNPSFEKLLGREGPISVSDMQAFTDFAMQLSYPPNPIRPLSNILTADQTEGRRVYNNVFTSPNSTVGCNTCHILDAANGNYGTAFAFIAVLGENSQDFKVPHFRNIYQKVGFFRQGSGAPQIRGFGLSEPGSSPGLMALVNSGDFVFENNQQSAQLASFIFAYDTLLAPIVGQQITLSAGSPAAVEQRIDLLMSRAQVVGLLPECDLIVKGVWQGQDRGAIRQDNDVFQSDLMTEQYSLSDLKNLGRQSGNHLTFMCVPPNSGTRAGIDRDNDGVFDADE